MTALVTSVRQQLKNTKATLCAPRPRAQVLVFGGGLSATVERGLIAGNNVSMGMTVLANSTLRVRSTNITDNTLKKGAVYGSWKSKLQLDHVIITGNSALHEGTAMYLVNANTSLRHSWFHDNVAGRDGGAIYAKSHSSLDIHNCSFDNNTAAGCGGAVFLSDTNCTLADSNFTNNRAADRGGAVGLQGVVDSAVSQQVMQGAPHIQFAHAGLQLVWQHGSCGRCTFSAQFTLGDCW